MLGAPRSLRLGIATTAARARTPDATVSQKMLPTESEKALSIPATMCGMIGCSLAGSVAASCFERFTPVRLPVAPDPADLKLFTTKRARPERATVPATSG